LKPYILVNHNKIVLPKLEQIKERREALQLKQKQLAKMCGIKPNLLNMIERRTTFPSHETWTKIENCLDKEEAKTRGKIKTAGEICISPFISIRQTDPINDAVQLMKKYDFSQLPVMSGSSCVGVITDHLILIYEANGGSLVSSKVKDVMGFTPPIIDEKTPITPQLLELLSNSSCLLVSHQNKVDGIITIIDAIRSKPK